MAQAGSQAGFGNVARAFRIPNYRVFATGNFISQIGYWIQRVAQAWLTWQLTQSGTWLDPVAAADLIPNVVISPFAGALADRVDRIRVIRLTQIVAILQAWTCWLASQLSPAPSADRRSFVPAYLRIRDSLTLLNQPARLRADPEPGRHRDLAVRGSRSISLMFNIARFIGLAVGGIVIAEAAVSPAFVVINACTYVAFSMALARVKVPPERLAPQRNFLRQSLDGYIYAVRHPGIGQMMILFSFGYNWPASAASTRCSLGFADVVFQPGRAGARVADRDDGVGRDRRRHPDDPAQQSQAPDADHN